MTSRVIKVDDINVLKKSIFPKVVYYTASWCGPCRKIAPLIDKLSIAYQGTHFFKVDIDEHQVEGINSVPTFMFYKDILSEPVVVKGANEIAIAKEVKKLQEPKY